MSRGPLIKQEEIDQAHKMKSEGFKVIQICDALKRTEPSVRKMLRATPTAETPNEHIQTVQA